MYLLICDFGNLKTILEMTPIIGVVYQFSTISYFTLSAVVFMVYKFAMILV